MHDATSYLSILEWTSIYLSHLLPRQSIRQLLRDSPSNFLSQRPSNKSRIRGSRSRRRLCSICTQSICNRAACRSDRVRGGPARRGDYVGDTVEHGRYEGRQVDFG